MKIRMVLLNLDISILYKFSCNIWVNIGDFLVGSMFLPPTFNGNNYRQFLEIQLPTLLEDVLLQIRNQMWFMQSSSTF